MAGERIPPRRPEGLRALLSPTPAPAHDVGKFLFTPPSCRPRGLPQVRETLRTQGPAGFPPRGNPRLTCKDFGDPSVNFSSLLHPAGRASNGETERQAPRPVEASRPCEDVGDPLVNSSQVRQASRQAGKQAGRQATRPLVLLTAPPLPARRGSHQ